MDYMKPVLSTDALERIGRLKEMSLRVKQLLCPERARYLTQVYREDLSDPMIIKRARALVRIFSHMTVWIGDKELIVGNQASSLRAAPLFPEYTVQWILDEIDELEKRPGDRFLVTHEVRDELIDICTWWKGRTVHDRCHAMLPDEVKSAYEMGVLSATGNMTSGDGHIMLDFPKVLQVGVEGIIAEAEEELRGLDPTDPESVHRRTVLEAVIITYRAVINFAARYADLAEKLRAEARDDSRKTELCQMARICRRIPARPPESFREAVQTVWFMHLLSQIESNGHSMSLGRFDQYMYRFYTHDREAGIISDNDVVELLALLWLKLFGVTKIRPWSHTRFSGGGRPIKISPWAALHPMAGMEPTS